MEHTSNFDIVFIGFIVNDNVNEYFSQKLFISNLICASNNFIMLDITYIITVHFIQQL